ncbi:MAG: hypothetical protein II529_01980 [Erysipelotrichaceae bacterium]|nr:hypothetical protein [Erysipelotrichaceae bacterium]
MKHKLIKGIILVMIAMMICACTKQEDPKQETAVIPEEILGNYYDEIAGRGMLKLKKNGDVTIDWSSSAYETVHWEMHTEYDPETKVLNYRDGIKKVLTYAEDETVNETEVYTDGTGAFTVEDKALIWVNDKNDNGNQDIVFVRDFERPVEETGMINPWIETDDLNKAVKEAGVEFNQIASNALPKADNAVSFRTYMSMPGIFSAIFRGNDNEMIIRKSLTLSGRDLAGDFNEYPDVWEEEYKGLKIECEGTEPSINLASFDIAGEHHTITFRGKEEGQGLSIDEITTLMEELFPEDLMK